MLSSVSLPLFAVGCLAFEIMLKGFSDSVLEMKKKELGVLTHFLRGNSELRCYFNL